MCNSLQWASATDTDPNPTEVSNPEPIDMDSANEPEIMQDEKNEGLFGRPTRLLREKSKYTFNATVFSYGLVIFYKTGIGAGYHLTKNLTIEPEYFFGSLKLAYKDVDFGSFSEKYYILPLKLYPNSNSFYFTLGIGQRQIEASLGDSMLSRLSGIDFDISVIKIKNTILEMGIGNRWQYDSGFTLTINWLELFIPIGDAETDAPFLDYVVNESDRKNVKTAIDVLDSLPTFTIFKTQLGYSF